MGKRSSFKRRPQDKYRTFDPRGAATLAPYLPWGCRFWEPCAAAGDLVRNLQAFGPECVAATDITPEAESIYRLDAMTATRADVDATGATHIITNPPWTRDTLHRMITHFSALRPTWLLFDADWLFTAQSAPYVSRLARVVPVGRLKWIEGSPHQSKDSCAWYQFDARHEGPTEFVGRAA
jgi:hypothetical protein